MVRGGGGGLRRTAADCGGLPRLGVLGACNNALLEGPASNAYPLCVPMVNAGPWRLASLGIVQTGPSVKPARSLHKRTGLVLRGVLCQCAVCVTVAAADLDWNHYPVSRLSCFSPRFSAPLS